MITYINIFYLISAVCFILGIKKLSHPKTARSGNSISAIGMFIAIIAVLYQEFVKPGHMDWSIIFIGVLIGTIIGMIAAIKVEMTQMPQLVAIFNGLEEALLPLLQVQNFYLKQHQTLLLSQLLCLVL
mgnify:CR=1 FL=1